MQVRRPDGIASRPPSRPNPGRSLELGSARVQYASASTRRHRLWNTILLNAVLGSTGLKLATAIHRTVTAFPPLGYQLTLVNWRV
jgi:hypothetical protein